MQWLNRGRNVIERVIKGKLGFLKTRTYRFPKKLSPGPIDFPATLLKMIFLLSAQYFCRSHGLANATGYYSTFSLISMLLSYWLASLFTVGLNPCKCLPFVFMKCKKGLFRRLNVNLN